MADDAPLMLELWIGGPIAARLRAASKSTGKAPETILLDLAARINPEFVSNGHYIAVCGNCGIPFYSARKPRDWERMYCSDECRHAGANARQARYRARHRL